MSTAEPRFVECEFEPTFSIDPEKPSLTSRPAFQARVHPSTDNSSYRESLQRLARYKKLCSAEEFRFTNKGDELLVDVSWPFAGEEPPPELVIDAVFALVLELGMACRAPIPLILTR